MATIKLAYGTQSTVGISLHSTAMVTGAARESDYQSNLTALFFDALFQVKVTPGSTAAPSSSKAINVYAYGGQSTADLQDNVTGTDAGITLRSPTNLRMIGSLQTPDASTAAYVSPPFSVAAGFGGVLPPIWGIVVENKTGLQFASSSGKHAATLTGVLSTNA